MKSRRVVLAGFALWLSAFVGACRETPRALPSAPAQGVDALRVLSYNIHHGEGTDGELDLKRIASVIADASPDLVALQEVDLGAERTGGVDQAAELARLTGMHHAFAPFMEFQGGEYGLAILSKHPIASTRAIDLPSGVHEPRRALAAEIGIPGHAFVTFVSVHLDWLEDDGARFAQAEALVGALEDAHGVILAGDFNDVPGSRTIELFERGYSSAAKPSDLGGTYPSDVPSAEIDYVMHRPGYAFVGTATVLGESVASDHRPVLAVLEWVHGK